MSCRRDLIKLSLAAAASAGIAPTALPSFAQGVTLLNVSHDPTRELYVDHNTVFFGAYWKAETGQEVTIKQSQDEERFADGGSSDQIYTAQQN